MRISSAFPSNYIRAADLQGRTVRVAIDRIEMEDIGGDHKPVIYFVGKEKGLVLNKTNAGNISTVYGDDTDQWQGGEIELFPTMVDFQGRSVDAIRVRIPPRAPAQRQTPPPPAENDYGTASGPSGQRTSLRAELNDEIPFEPEFR